MGKKRICIGLMFLGIFLFTACGNDSKSSTISEINNSNVATGALSESGTDGSAQIPGSEENGTAMGQNEGSLTGSMDSMPNGSLEPGTDNQSGAGDEIIVFKAGTWECLDGDEALGYVYVESGKEEIAYTDLSEGSTTNYMCEVEGNQITLINGSAVFASGAVEQLDEDTVIITLERGNELTFVYVSEKTGEERE